MKNIIMLCLIAGFLFPVAAEAQFEKDKVLIGLSTRMGIYEMTSSTSTDIFSLGFSSIKIKSDADNYEEPPSDKLTSFNIMPKVGYFLVDGFAFGLEFCYTSFSYKDGQDDDKSSMNTFGIGPFVRYYLPVKKVSPFIEGDLLFGSTKSKYEPSNGDSNESTINLFAWGAGAGLAFPVGEHVAFDLMVGYNSYTQKEKDDNEENYRNVIGTFGVKFGFVILLGSGKK